MSIDFVEDRDQSQKIETSRYRRDITGKAIERLQDEIIAEDGISADKAIELGGNYLAYFSEGYLHAEDVAGELLKQDVNAQPAREIYSEDRRKYESALMDASHGEFTKLKDYLKVEATAKIVLSGDHNQRDKNLGEKLLHISELIPDMGKPFKSPKPAWMDKTLTESDLEE